MNAPLLRCSTTDKLLVGTEAACDGPKQQYTHDVSRLHLVKIWINIATITVFVWNLICLHTNLWALNVCLILCQIISGSVVKRWLPSWADLCHTGVICNTDTVTALIAPYPSCFPHRCPKETTGGRRQGRRWLFTKELIKLQPNRCVL